MGWWICCGHKALFLLSCWCSITLSMAVEFGLWKKYTVWLWSSKISQNQPRWWVSHLLFWVQQSCYSCLQKKKNCANISLISFSDSFHVTNAMFPSAPQFPKFKKQWFRACSIKFQLFAFHPAWWYDWLTPHLRLLCMKHWRSFFANDCKLTCTQGACWCPSSVWPAVGSNGMAYHQRLYSQHPPPDIV